MTTNKITYRQLMALAFISLLSPIVRVVPDSSVVFGGKAAWLSPVVAIIPVILLFLLIQKLLKNRANGEGLSHIMIRTFGGFFGRAVNTIFILWIVFYTGFVLRTAVERLLSTVYTNGSEIAFTIVILLTACIAASGQLKSLARTAQVFVPILVALIIMVFVLVVMEVKIENLLPVTYYDIPYVLLGSIHMINAMVVFVYYVFLFGDIQDDSKKRGIGYIFGLGGVIAVIIVSTIGVLSTNVAKSLQSPFFTMIKNVEFFRVFERIDALVIGFWVISDFMYLGSLLTIGSDIMMVTVKSKKRTLWVWILGAVAFAISFIVSRSAFDLTRLSSYLVPAVNLFLTVLIIPIILVIAKLRKVI